ncbi:hypothetical protein [Blautia hansenii]|uniref:hypothetical protein n=1 Tax=Blautia hansenii TaxID=1322 RepID=UPI0022E1F77A|nr:hypothetical protein [Blautia hansenii]
MKKVIVINNKVISNILYFQFFYVFFYAGLVDFFHIPSIITYGIDVLNVICFLFFLYSNNRKMIFLKSHIQYIYIMAIIVFLGCILTAVVNLVNPLLVMWGVRNSLRYFPFFFSIIAFWSQDRLEQITQFLIKFQVVNFIIILYQFFIKGYSQDLLGGIFGHTMGCNAALNMYLCIVVTLVIERFLRKKASGMILAFTLLSWTFIAAAAELKSAFLEIPVIILLAIFLNKPSIRSFLIIILAIIGLNIGLSLIVQYFPDWAHAFTDIQSLISVGEKTGGGYNISRFGAFSDITNLFFKDSVVNRIFGLGMGNCEYSSFSFLTSEFYREFGFLNYRWFSHQMWFLQCGYLGIIMLGIMIFMLFIWVTKRKLKYRDEYGYGSFGQIFMLLMIVNFMYNASFITEIGYMAFAALALPFVYYKNEIMSK